MTKTTESGVYKDLSMEQTSIMNESKNPKQELQVHDRRHHVPADIGQKSGGGTLMETLASAVQRGLPVETLNALMDFQERMDRDRARKEFDAAIAAAKAEIPVILKNRTVDFTSPKGRTNYRHEDLAAIARAVDPVLARHGLSYRFRTVQEGQNVTVTCVVSHSAGHSEENSLVAGRDDSGNKNNIQGVGSTITYLQRYTLKAALGLAASHDDDAASAPEEPEYDTSQWTERIIAAETPEALEKIAADLKAAKDIPHGAMVILRAAWAGQRRRIGG